MLTVYSTLNRDVVNFFETSVTIHKDTQCRSGGSGDSGGGCVFGDPDGMRGGGGGES
jgi:hypothetical protein